MADSLCFSCQTKLTIDGVVGRNETCPKCGEDVRACFNCRHYDKSAYNECRETQAERVVNKDRANFCDYFALDMNDGISENTNAEALKKLDELFK